MGFYEDQLLPRIIDCTCGNRWMAPIRRPTVAGLRGVVVEIGFGSGPNVPLYPAAVTRVLAVDPARVGRKLAARRLAASPVPVEFIGLDGEHLPIEAGTVDCVLSTFTLCTIPDAHQALAEARRVLRADGELHYLEHGVSPDPRVARRQARFEPVQRRIAGGCHLTRDIEALVLDGGFALESASQFDVAGPRILGHLYTGVARPA